MQALKEIVEKVLVNAQDVMTISELKKKLPKQITKETLKSILNYFDNTNKIVLHDDRVLWVYNPGSKLRKLNCMRVR